MSDLLSMPAKLLGGGGGGGGGWFSNLLSQIQPAPVVTPVPVMPVPDDKAVLMQKRRTLAEQMRARGRASTILTSEGTLGAPPQPLGGP